MKLILILALGLLLAGCDYTVPLANEPDLAIDSEVLGLWQRQKPDGTMEQLLVLPLGAKEYLVSYPAGGRSAMYARAGLLKVGDLRLFQLRWVGSGDGGVPDDNKVYQYFSCDVSGTVLTTRQLNTDVIPSELTNAEQLRKALVENRSNEKLFAETMKFSKMEK